MSVYNWFWRSALFFPLGGFTVLELVGKSLSFALLRDKGEALTRSQKMRKRQ